MMLNVTLQHPIFVSDSKEGACSGFEQAPIRFEILNRKYSLKKNACFIN